MCQAMGLDQRSRRRRVESNTILSDGYAIQGIIMPPLGPGGVAGDSSPFTSIAG